MPGEAHNGTSVPRLLPVRNRFWRLLLYAGFAFGCLTGVPAAERFALPTANPALFEPGGAERYFVGTPGKSYTAGYFGCVRSDGRQMHEGIDIRCVHRDKRGEPADLILATADGTVAYVSRKSALSNYGKYVILRHQVQEIELYSLYAHLSEIPPEIQPGRRVTAGETIGVMGRTANTREGISRERAHLHFEINLLLNDGFAAWYKKHAPDQRNDHGLWNGQNLVGIDPRLLFLEQRRLGSQFSLKSFIQSDVELCRVLVRKTSFPWVRRYRPLVDRNLQAEREGAAGYELVLNYNGLPIRAIPRAPSEFKSRSPVVLLRVDDSEQRRHPGRALVVRERGRWELTQKGRDWIGLLTY